MSDRKRDQIYAQPAEMIVDFVFDENVVEVFPDMIRRSVPGYDAIITLLGLFAERYAQPHTNIYDLGCSTGAATLALRRRIALPGVTLYAVDNSPAMIERCRQNLLKAGDGAAVECICADISQIAMNNASVVVLNFTLQFLPPEQRLGLLSRIYSALCPGGVLILSEKVQFNTADEQIFQEGMQLAFKKANGYSDLEISQKRTALEKVLIPETVAQHLQRLSAAGFTQARLWFQSFNFISIAAMK